MTAKQEGERIMTAKQEQEQKIKTFNRWWGRHRREQDQSMENRASLGWACAQKQKELGYATQQGVCRKNMVRALEITPWHNSVEDFTRYYLHGGRIKYWQTEAKS